MAVILAIIYNKQEQTKQSLLDDHYQSHLIDINVIKIWIPENGWFLLLTDLLRMVGNIDGEFRRPGSRHRFSRNEVNQLDLAQSEILQCLKNVHNFFLT